MLKNKLKNYKPFIVLFVLLLCLRNFAAVVSDNDGSAFITKVEFDSLRNNFQARINQYNTSIDDKINEAIASYLSGVIVETDLDSLLNKLSDDRRTFIGNISNPTTSTQENLLITTNGFWCLLREVAEGGPNYWAGYCFTGFNNRENGTITKGVVEHDNLNYGNRSGNGKYIFIEPYTNEEDETDFKISDANLKKLKFVIWSCGAATDYGAYITTAPSYYTISSITWNNTYNWNGKNNRPIAIRGSTIDYVEAAEAIFLEINNSDEIPWVKHVTGGTIFDAETGCLKEKDQYTWTYRYTNFSLGDAGSQCYGAKYNSSNTYTLGTNSNNLGTSEHINLNFYAPKISGINGKKLLCADASDVSNDRVHYYNGLPLCKVNKSGEMTIEIVPTLNGTGTTDFILAIKNGQFDNVDIGNEPSDKILYRKSLNINDDDIVDGKIKIKIESSKLKGIKNKNIYVKALATNGTDSSITLKTESIKIKYDK